MNRLFRLSMPLVFLASGACTAADSSTCQPDCAQEKRECSSRAQQVSKRENGPLESMNEKLPHIRYSGDARGRSIDVRAGERQDFENRRLERNRSCDDKYMKCVNACQGPGGVADQDSVVLKRKDEL